MSKTKRRIIVWGGVVMFSLIYCTLLGVAMHDIRTALIVWGYVMCITGAVTLLCVGLDWIRKADH